MREYKKLIGKALKTVATVTSESASLFCLYEPKMPAQLLKNNTTEKCQKEKKNV